MLCNDMLCELCNKEYPEGTTNGRCMFCGKTVVEDAESNCLKFTQVGDKEKPICSECFEMRGYADQMSSLS